MPAADLFSRASDSRHICQVSRSKRSSAITSSTSLPSRVELASMIEARPETVTRALGKLARDGVVTVGKATIVVHDLRALRALVPHEVTGESASTATDATAVA